MISLGLALAFVAEVAVYILVCVGLWGIHVATFPLGALVVVLVTLAIIVRAAVPLVSFGAAWLWGAPRPPELQWGFVRTLTTAVAEILSFLFSVFLLMPFARQLTVQRKGHVTTNPQPPVLFIHGYSANSGVWAPLLAYLWERGVTNLFTIDLVPRFGSIDDYAQQVATRVTRICSTTRAQKVILVGHSMGGLAARAFVEQCGGAEKVAKVITIASPHHGSLLARIAPGMNGAQMRFGSTFIEELNREENVSHDVKYVSVYSPHDNMVIPYNSAELGKARNIPIPGKGHFELLFCKQVGHIVHREISGH